MDLGVLPQKPKNMLTLLDKTFDKAKNCEKEVEYLLKRESIKQTLNKFYVNNIREEIYIYIYKING